MGVTQTAIIIYCKTLTQQISEMKVFVIIFALSLSLGLAKKCSIDFDCPSIQKCEAGSCVEENNPESCNKRSDCLRSDYGYACVKGKCGCSITNQDCPAGNFCTKKRCLTSGKYSLTEIQCKNSNLGHKCVDGQCICNSNIDCNINYGCKDRKCVMDKEKMKEDMHQRMKRSTSGEMPYPENDMERIHDGPGPMSPHHDL